MLVKTENIKFSITSIGIIFGFLISISYAFGYIYDQGYLNQYGLSSEYFTRTNQEYLFKFYYLLVSGVSAVLPEPSVNIFYYALVIFFILTFFFLFLMKAERKREGNIKAKEKIKEQQPDEKNTSNKIISDVVECSVKSFSFLSMICLSSLVLLLVILVFLIPMLKGSSDAISEMKKYSKCVEGQPHIYNCSFVYRDKEKILSGLLIAMSDKKIAIWNGKKAIVYPLNGEVVVIEKAKKKAEKKTTHKLDTGNTK